MVKTVTGTLSDLQPNVNVTVIGARNADGSVSARSVSITPGCAGGLGGLFGGGSGRGAYGGTGGGFTGAIPTPSS